MWDILGNKLLLHKGSGKYNYQVFGMNLPILKKLIYISRFDVLEGNEFLYVYSLHITPLFSCSITIRDTKDYQNLAPATVIK